MAYDQITVLRANVEFNLKVTVTSALALRLYLLKEFLKFCTSFWVVLGTILVYLVHGMKGMQNAHA